MLQWQIVAIWAFFWHTMGIQQLIPYISLSGALCPQQSGHHLLLHWALLSQVSYDTDGLRLVIPILSYLPLFAIDIFSLQRDQKLFEAKDSVFLSFMPS